MRNISRRSELAFLQTPPITRELGIHKTVRARTRLACLRSPENVGHRERLVNLSITSTWRRGSSVSARKHLNLTSKDPSVMTTFSASMQTTSNKQQPGSIHLSFTGCAHATHTSQQEQDRAVIRANLLWTQGGPWAGPHNTAASSREVRGPTVPPPFSLPR